MPTLHVGRAVQSLVTAYSRGLRANLGGIDRLRQHGPGSRMTSRRGLCTFTMLRVDWERESALAIAQQRTIETLEAGIAAGGDPEQLLDAAEAEDIAEEGAFKRACWVRGVSAGSLGLDQDTS